MMNNNHTNNPQTILVAAILQAATHGATKAYIDQACASVVQDNTPSEYIPLMVFEELLLELTDKNRQFTAYKTTERGLEILKTVKRMCSMVGQPIAA